ncbi:hypothetical protein N8822_01200 [Candidatus Pelagibacter ubique]|nr:hypothetical protein [Candidatus Pelagibacter ubique]
MKKKEIVFLVSFKYLDAYLNLQKNLIDKFSKSFDLIHFVNVDKLRMYSNRLEINQLNYIYSKNKIFKKKKIEFFNPNNLKELRIYLVQKNCIIVNTVTRSLEYFRVLRLLKKENLKQIVLGNIGNIQMSVNYWHKHNINTFLNFFYKFLARWILRVFVILRFINPIEVRFVSNQKFYKGFARNENSILLKIFPRYYKKVILVKSKIFDEISIKKKYHEKYIVHLDQYPYSRDTLLTGNLKKKDIDIHYKNLSNFLKHLSKLFKKKVIISIHPDYNQKWIKKKFVNYKVVKFQTKKLIENSFIVTFFDSSAILYALNLNKKILSIRSKLFYHGKKYNSDLYSDLINLKKIDIDKKKYLHLGKINFLNELNEKKKNYKKYLNIYSSNNLKISGTKVIIDYINSNFFIKKL